MVFNEIYWIRMGGVKYGFCVIVIGILILLEMKLCD